MVAAIVDRVTFNTHILEIGAPAGGAVGEGHFRGRDRPRWMPRAAARLTAWRWLAPAAAADRIVGFLRTAKADGEAVPEESRIAMRVLDALRSATEVVRVGHGHGLALPGSDPSDGHFRRTRAVSGKLPLRPGPKGNPRDKCR